MRLVFADTIFWIAIFLPDDPWSAAARSVSLEDIRLVTTEEALAEFLTGVSSFGSRTRLLACELVRHILSDPGIEVVVQSHESFRGGLSLYENRSDKQYSLADCISMNVMRRRGIVEVLSTDRHFAQEGFVRLLPRKG